ncbi:hypothetical protein RKE29_18610 [Streptomyces sp. B1866]|uniref:hypothetical protein n=1 Tax=Streptomyces sp. B1866 TaxID=3075431 RepID=UPI002890A424|nr:hypothetical protein [Streptomyces sp. B1866]MDT3398632.1 hypothetical protein [Streptomyces sp. B1866]
MKAALRARIGDRALRLSPWWHLRGQWTSAVRLVSPRRRRVYAEIAEIADIAGEVAQEVAEPDATGPGGGSAVRWYAADGFGPGERALLAVVFGPDAVRRVRAARDGEDPA